MAANLRAARALEADYAEDRRSLAESGGPAGWPTPRLLDWNSWVAELWEQYARRAWSVPDAKAAEAMPLTLLQEHQLWKQVLGPDRDRVVAPDRMAELAQGAYELLSSYRAHALRRVATSGLFVETHEDAERFLAWAAAFDRMCEQHRWVSRTRLVEALVDGVSLLDRPAEVWLVGFDRTTPAQDALLGAFSEAGTTISHYVLAIPPAGQPLLIEAKDQSEELEACAWWCRDQLTRSATALGTDAAESPLRIGVIVPDLQRVRAQLDRVFRRILMPQTTLWSEASDAADPPMPYEFSLGTPLAALPLVRSALLVLRWLAAPLSSTDLTWLLTSGFIASSAADQAALVRLDTQLRASPEVSLAWLLEHGRRLPTQVRARLERTLSMAGRARAVREPAGTESRASRRQSYAHWAEVVPVLLSEAGWPGYREVDSFAYQVQQRWTRLLGELAELGFDGSQPTWTEFLHTLETQARAVIFAAESSSPPVQILGAFESSGQSFDALWFLGADDSHWPAVGRPHPLLPAWLQRDMGMPHASPEADWLLAQQATARLVASAPKVVLSYPTNEGGVELRASPLVLAHAHTGTSRRIGGPDVKSLQVLPGELAGNKAARLQTAEPGTLLSLVAARSDERPVPSRECALNRTALERIADDSGALPWPVEQSAGGAEIIKRQAACAFQSFAMRRLGARALDDAEQGLSARERGTLMHQVLEQIWSSAPAPRRLHTLDDLFQAIGDGSVAELVAHQIEAVFAPALTASRGDPWQVAYLKCEQQRVLDRLLDWLACEAQRQPFSVAAIETSVSHMQVGSLRLNVRPDRIDTLADGTRLLIDYKTGKVTAGAWDGERPEEPQLPLYALFGGVERVSGVAFAQIRAGDTKLVARAEDVATQLSSDLGKLSAKNRFDDEIRDGWRTNLLALADDFVRGDACVNPRDGAQTCKYCPLAGLCRVHATGALLEEDDEETVDE